MPPYSKSGSTEQKKGTMMKKGHYKITLEVTTTEADDVDGVEELEGMEFWPDDCDEVDVQDVTIKSVEVIE